MNEINAMDKYSRLLVQFGSINASNSSKELYSNFVNDLAVLENPDDELLKLISNDLPSILPAIVIISGHVDISVRTAVAKTFETFINILKSNPSFKQDTWWKDLEAKVISQHFSSRLIKMVETNDEPWSTSWAFVITLIVHDEHVHGVAINSMLKVVETAFKMSRKNDAILEKAYFCWNKLIDIFSLHPRVVTSQKLVELLVRPLSTVHLSMKCPDLRMKTWCNLVRKIGFACGNKCKFVIEPFLESIYIRETDSLCSNYPKDCIQAYSEVIEQKKIFKYFALKVVSAFPACHKTCTSEEMEDLLVTKIWTGILENIPEVDKGSRSEYTLDIFDKFHKVLKNKKSGLNLKLMKIFVEKKIFCSENLKLCIQSELSLLPMFSEFMEYEDFRKSSLPYIVKELKASFSESITKKQQNNMDLEIWDFLSETLSAWISSMTNRLDAQNVDIEILTSLLMIPLLNKQWSVAVQKTWYAVVESIQSTVCADSFLTLLLNKIGEGIKDTLITSSLCVEICTHLTNKNKAAYKAVMPTLSVASTSIDLKDSKPLMDLLVLLENAIGHVPKNDLIKYLNELMVYGNKFEQPYGLRIKTKISKAKRKLFMLKENDDGDGSQQKSQENDQQSGQKTRSPIMAQSSFLQRLAKAEEKKKRKCPSMASIFGESSPGNIGIEINGAGTNSDKTTLGRVASPLPIIQIEPTQESKKDDKNQVDEGLINGRCSSPVLPTTVSIVTHTRLRRSRSKSPEPVQPKPKSFSSLKSPKTPTAPTYFEDNAQDYVIVPAKSKVTPLTEHQKEILSRRRSDIPALYQDLSQDTQTSTSQSLKEIVLLNESRTVVNETGNTEELKQNDAEDDNTQLQKDNVQGSDVPNAVEVKILSSDENNSVEVSKSCQPVVDTNSEEITSGQLVTKTEEADPSGKSNTKDVPVSSESSSDDKRNKTDIEDVEVPLEKSIDSQDIIYNTPQVLPPVALTLTPTKQPAPPTPKNLISKMLESEDDPDLDEEEHIREKENIILNSKLIDKTPVMSVKKRPGRKSSPRIISKQVEDAKDGMLKSKKEHVDESVTEKPHDKNGSSDEDLVLDPINAKTELNTVSSVLNDTVGGKSSEEIALSSQNSDNLSKNNALVSTDYINEKTSKKETLEISTECPKVKMEETNHKIEVYNSKMIRKDELPPPDKNTIYLSFRKCRNNNKVVNNNDDSDNKSESTDLIVNENIEKSSDKVVVVTNDDNNSEKLNSNMNNLPTNDLPNETDGNSESPNTDVSDWALTTPGKRAKKKKTSEGGSQFSPKQLRSKKLSLTKKLETPESNKKRAKKSLSSVNEVPNVASVGPKDLTDKVSSPIELSEEPKQNTPKVENSPAVRRKRKIEDSGNDQVEEKISKRDSTLDDTNHDQPLLVVKNMSGIKPRKKKIIKANAVKIPTNNLEQWVIKSGKSIVKTNMADSESIVLNESEPIIIDDERPDLQINVSESNKIVVEQIDTPSTSKDSPVIDDTPQVTITEASPDLNDLNNSTMISDSSSLLLQISSSEDETAASLNETNNDIKVEDLQCHEPELPSTPTGDGESSAKQMGRRKRRLLVREGTPCRELGSPEDEASDSKRERILPLRSTRPGRSAQMVMMATSEEDTEQAQKPIRKRSSIQPFIRTDNWPEGRIDPWVPCMPTPPGLSPSLGILKRRAIVPPPTASPTSSPSVKKKRVSFLDPPVFSGLMYAKGSEAKGEVQYADIPPGEKPVWKEEEDIEEPDQAGPSTSTEPGPTEPMDGGSPEVDELTAIQEFLNSTPDAPWSQDVPTELDLSRVAGLENCSLPISQLINNIYHNEQVSKQACVELEKLNITNVSDLQSLSSIDFRRFCKKFPQMKSLASIVEDFLKEKAVTKSEVKFDDGAEVTDVETNEDVFDSNSEIQVESTPVKKEQIKKVDKTVVLGDVEKKSVKIKEAEENSANEGRCSQTEGEKKPMASVKTIEQKQIQTDGEELMEVLMEEPMETIEVEMSEAKDEDSKSTEDSLFTVSSKSTRVISSVDTKDIVDNKSTQNTVDNKSTHTICSVDTKDTVDIKPTCNITSAEDTIPIVLGKATSYDIPTLLKDEDFVTGLVDHIPVLLERKDLSERIGDRMDSILAEGSPFFQTLAAYADYSFIARLCSAIHKQRGHNPP